MEEVTIKKGIILIQKNIVKTIKCDIYQSKYVNM